jgi:hypothetical protein
MESNNSLTYLIGYGSLMNKYSLYRSVNKDYIGNVIPIYLSKWKRCWTSSCKNLGYSIVTMKYTNNQSDHVNAVLIPIISGYETKVLSSLDKREYCYRKSQVDLCDIKNFYNEKNGVGLKDVDAIFVYTIQEPILLLPTIDIPIPQSYLDIIIEGTILIDKQYKHKNKKQSNFSKTFLKTTENFNKDNLLLDRFLGEYTKSKRKFTPKVHWNEIDNLIQDQNT